MEQETQGDEKKGLTKITQCTSHGWKVFGVEDVGKLSRKRQMLLWLIVGVMVNVRVAAVVRVRIVCYFNICILVYS